MPVQPYTPEYLAEKALQALAQQFISPGYLEAIYLSDSRAERKRPCLSILCKTCEEQKLGQDAKEQWQTGVFKAQVDLVFEEKAYKTESEQSSNAWGEMRNIFYNSQALAGANGILTNAIPDPFHVHYCFLLRSSQEAIPEFQLFQKTLTVEMIFMTIIDSSS